jgi:hypothetical protein
MNDLRVCKYAFKPNSRWFLVNTEKLNTQYTVKNINKCHWETGVMKMFMQPFHNFFVKCVSEEYYSVYNFSEFMDIYNAKNTYEIKEGYKPKGEIC